ncbi:MAG: hypothetical protein R3E39_08655 [Anaerolineae bacterium]
MAGSRISYNVHAHGVSNHDGFIAHLERLQPKAILIMDHLGLAERIKAALPETTVIHRNWGVTQADDNVFAKVSPQRWIDLRGKETDGKIMLHTSCEPGWGQDVIDWHIKLMDLCIPRGIPLVIGNWAVGTPQPEQWAMARHMLELLDQHRDLFVLGLHEYACGVITSGLVGGAPDDPRHPNFIPVDNWPQSVHNITRFHCGRFNFLVEYCQSIGLKPPRIIMTEHGFDDVSDIKPWASTLRLRGPYLNIRGWKTLVDQWTDWYGGRGWSAERAMFEQLVWADRTIYQPSPVEAQCIFCWGHTDQAWEQFDVSEAHEFQSLLEGYAQHEPINQPVTPVGQPVAQPIQPVGQPAPPPPPAGFAPVGQPPPPPPPTGFAPIGVAPVGQPVPGAGKPPTVLVEDAPETPATPFTTLTAPTAKEKLYTLTLTANEIDIIVAGLREMGRVTRDAKIIAAFTTLAAALEREKGAVG